MSLPEITVKTVVASMLAIDSPVAVNSSSAISVPRAAEASPLELVSDYLAATPVNSGVTFQPITVDTWTADKNIRYKQLARDEALRELSIEELAELDSLTRLRRFANYPRSADEILWQRQQHDLTRALVQALQNYVQFHESSNNPQALSEFRH